MKIIAYTALHYGRDYLAYAIRSVIDNIDELHVLYTPIGSHGHRTSAPCPETRDELYAIAQAAAGDKLRWHEGEWPYEGAQRESIHQYAPDADVIIVLDADEIWSEHLAFNVVNSYKNWLKEPRIFGDWPFSRMRANMIHYWRSMHRAILHDPAFPERVIYPKWQGPVETIQPHYGLINHMGYAQRPEIVQYKQLTHGHKNEWRKDVDWFRDVFLANRQTDCHPVGSDAWQPEPVNPLDYMPAWMTEHPYYGMDVIE